MASYTLLENPNPYKKQYRYPRRKQPSGVIVVHSAENVPGVKPPDSGAEGVASYISRRRNAGSYHVVVDSDSIVHVLPPSYEAWQDGTGTNPHAYAISGAFRAAGWNKLPEWWREQTLKNMATAAREYAVWIKQKYGVVIPGRLITRDESSAGVPGFISHALRDPGRRTDPGVDFPWDRFFKLYLGGAPSPQPPSDSGEEDDMGDYLEVLDALYDLHYSRSMTSEEVLYWGAALRTNEMGPKFVVNYAAKQLSSDQNAKVY